MRLLILASASDTRAAMLRNAGLTIEVRPAPVDEDALREGLVAEGASARDVADALAEHKAVRVAGRAPEALLLGCDQVLEFRGQVLGKPADATQARDRLWEMRGHTHRLLTAAVLYDRGAPVWRHVDEAELTMRAFSEAFLDAYVAQAGWALTGSTGGYAIEGLGARLFAQVRGDHFGILGLPLLTLLTALARRGDILA